MTEAEQILKEWVQTLPQTVKDTMKKVIYALRSEYDLRGDALPGFFFEKVKKDVFLGDVYEILEILQKRGVLKYEKGTYDPFDPTPDYIPESLTLNMDYFLLLEDALTNSNLSAPAFTWHPLNKDIDWSTDGNGSGVLKIKNGMRFRFRGKTFQALDLLIKANGQPVTTKELKKILDQPNARGTGKSKSIEVAKWKNDLMTSREDFAQHFDIIFVPGAGSALILKTSDTTTIS